MTAPEGYRCAAELLQLPERPTALFCFNDSMAMRAYDAVKQFGLTIPDDIAIVGFDNLEVIAAQLRPPLTTMELPHYQMGQWAVQYLLEHADGSALAPIQHTIACRLIERASVEPSALRAYICLNMHIREQLIRIIKGGWCVAGSARS